MCCMTWSTFLKAQSWTAYTAHIVHDVKAALARQQLCGFPPLSPWKPEPFTITNWFYFFLSCFPFLASHLKSHCTEYIPPPHLLPTLTSFLSLSLSVCFTFHSVCISWINEYRLLVNLPTLFSWLEGLVLQDSYFVFLSGNVSNLHGPQTLLKVFIRNHWPDIHSVLVVVICCLGTAYDDPR